LKTDEPGRTRERNRLLSWPGMRALVTGARSHLAVLWPRHAWLPALPFWGWMIFWWIRGGLRWEHAALAVVATVLAYGSRTTKRLYLALLPLALVAVLYDAMRFVQNVGLSVDNVHVCDLRAAESQLFGVALNGVRGTWHDWLQAHSALWADVLCAIPYATFIYVVMGYAVFLYLRDFSAGQRFTWGFFALNVAAFITYHLYPAAPPWYYHRYGCVVDLAARASEGPNLARVDALLGVHYFAGFYGRASDVFGAVPSLHVAYPLLMLVEGWSKHAWVGRLSLVLFYLCMCVAAVYLDHHWVLDLLAGSLYALAVAWLMPSLFGRARA
jgi:hypothetical protein